MGLMSVIIEALNLRKTFTSDTQRGVKIKALDDLSITVSQGEILGLLGPNGAGKTTLLNVLASLLLPESGRVTIAGIESNPKNFIRLRRILNMSSGYPNLPFSLTVEENLRFYSRLYGLYGPGMRRKIEELINLFGLQEFRHRRFDELSSGNKQRLVLAKSMLNDPQVLFLDEPTVGLDPDVALKMRAAIMDLLKSRKMTVLLTTHNMDEAEAMCNRVAFIKGGKILRLASPEELKKAHQTDDLEEVFVKLAQSKAPPVIMEEGPHAQPSATDFVRTSAVEDKRIFKWINRAGAFALRNYIFAVRNFFSFVELLFWPLVTLISVGLMGAYLQLEEAPLNFIMTGAIAGGILQVTQLDVAYNLLYEIWSKSLKQTLLTPIGVMENLFGSWLIGIARGLIIFAILGVCATGFFQYHFPPLGVTAVFLAGMFMCALLLGILVNVLILSFGQKAEITAWMFAYLFMLLCGIYYPVSVLPPFFKMLAQAIPITYFLEFFRHSQASQAVIGFALLGVYFVLGLMALRGAYHRARRKGIIIRLSE